MAPGTSNCSRADVVLVLDSSGSVGMDNWFKVLDFSKSLVKSFPILGLNGVQFGVVSYGNRATVQFHLNSFATHRELYRAIELIPWKDQETNTSGGLRTMNELMFVKERGDREGVPNIGIVLTDGVSNRDENLTIPEADKARQNGRQALPRHSIVYLPWWLWCYKVTCAGLQS